MSGEMQTEPRAARPPTRAAGRRAVRSATGGPGPCRGLRARAARAFSLLEVLIAVTVLGLGLLGIAAVFPVVITQQRRALDETAGAMAANGVAAELDRAGAFIDWQAILDDLNFNANVNDDDFVFCAGGELFVFPEGLWATAFGDGAVFGVSGSNSVIGTFPEEITLPGYEGNENEYLDEGTLIFGPQEFFDCPSSLLAAAGTVVSPNNTPLPGGAGAGTQNSLEVTLEAAARLIPQPFSDIDAQPEFIWDPILKRDLQGRLDLAIFVRRIDTNIRVPQGSTLSEVLASGPVANRTLPISRNGLNLEYSTPRSFQAFFDADEALDRLHINVNVPLDGLSNQDDVLRAMVNGQRLLDNLGVVRQVVEVLRDTANSEDATELIVRVQPPATPDQAVASGTTLNNAVFTAEPTEARYRLVRQVVFTDEVPAQILVRKVDP